MPDLFLRRAAVTAVALLALVAGGVAIRLASTWTQDAAALTERPATAAELRVQLDAEHAQADALRARLRTMSGRVDDLGAALDGARADAQSQAETAAALAAQLETAEAKLAELERTLAAAPPATAVTVAPAQAATVGAAEDESSGGDGEHEEREDEEHDD